MAKPTKKNFVIACKTFRGDSVSFGRLLASYSRYNSDKISLVVVVPEADKSIFQEIITNNENVSIITEESYSKDYLVNEPVMGLSVGYINQEICKLAFWETNISENVLFVDSDVYFIRDFHVSDFMATEDIPYSVLTMDKDLHTEMFYKEYGDQRKIHIKRIFDTVGVGTSRIVTCHGMTVLNATVLRDFKQNFLKPKKLSYAGILSIAPFEYSWYNAWLQKSQIIPIVWVEPFFKTFHMRIEYIFSRWRLISEQDIAKQYVGIILNSNWQDRKPPEAYENPGIIQKAFYSILSKLG